MKVPHLFLIIVGAHFLLVSNGFAQIETPAPTPTEGPVAESEHLQKSERYDQIKLPKRMFKDGKIIPYPTPGPEPRSAIYGMPNIEGRKQIEADIKEYNEKQGATVRVFATAAPYEPDELEFYEIPQAFTIGGCLYVNGYSYPDACSDLNGKEIFRAGKDPQSKLEEIREAYGVPSSDNNIVPPTYTISPETERELANAQGKVEVLREANTSEIVDTADGL